MAGKRLKVGILGASGKVGQELFWFLLERDYIDSIYIEMKLHNAHLINHFKDISGLSETDTMIIPVWSDVSGTYQPFADCDVIVIAAGAKMPENFSTRNNSLEDLMGFVSNDIESSIKRKIEKCGGIKKVKEEWQKKVEEIMEAGMYPELFNFIDEIPDDAFTRTKEVYIKNLDKVYEVCRVMEGLKKSSKVTMGYRATELFPRNVPIMKDYARILTDIGFEGLTMILTNVPDYCCNIFAAEAPHLIKRTMGMTYLDTMRINTDIIGKISKGSLPDFIRILIYCIGNHDGHMIVASDLIEYETKEKKRLRYSDLVKGIEVTDDISKEIQRIHPFVSLAIREYAPINKILRGTTEDEVIATHRVLKEISESYDKSRQGNVLTNSIFYKLNPHDTTDRTGIFVTLPHTMNGIDIEHCEIEFESGTATEARLERCVKEHEIMTRALIEAKKEIIREMPMLPEEEDKRITVFSGELPPEAIILTKSSRKMDGRKVNLYNPQQSHAPLNTFEYDSWQRLRYIDFDGRFAILNLMESIQVIPNKNKIKNTILRYLYNPENPPEKPEKTIIPGGISSQVLSVDDVVYAASTEDNNTCIMAFQGSKQVGVYKTKGKSKIYSLAVVGSKGERKILGSSDGKIHVWEEGSEKEKFSLEAEASLLTSLKVIGNLCFASNLTNKIYVWDIIKEKLLSAYTSYNGLYDAQELNGKVELALVSEDKAKSRYWIKVHPLIDGQIENGKDTGFKKQTTEAPTHISLVRDNIFVLKGENLCFADKTTELESLTLEGSDLETFCVYGGLR